MASTAASSESAGGSSSRRQHDRRGRQQLGVADLVGRTTVGRQRGEQVVEVAHDVVRAGAQRGDDRRRRLLDPGHVVVRDGEGVARCAPDQRAWHERALHVSGVRRRAALAGDGVVDPAQQLGLDDAERVVGALRLGVEAGDVEREDGRHALPQLVAGRPRGGHDDDVHALRGEPGGPAVQDPEDVLVAPELVVVVLAPDAAEELAVGHAGAHLHALLPGRRQHPAEVASGHDDVHLVGRRAEVTERPRRRVGRRVGEVLVADQHVPGPGAGLLDEPVPDAAVALAQVVDDRRHALDQGGGGEVVATRPSGQQEAARTQLVVVPPPQVLQVGRARLRGPDVEERAASHARDPTQGTLLSWPGIATSSTTAIRAWRRGSPRVSTRACRPGTRQCCSRWCASSTSGPTAGWSTWAAARARMRSGSRRTSASGCSASTPCNATSTWPARPGAGRCPTSPRGCPSSAARRRTCRRPTPRSTWSGAAT